MVSSGRHDNADLAPDIAVADCGSGLRGLVPKHDRPGKLLRLQLQRAAASCSPPPPDAGAEVPDRGARNAGCNRNPQSHWARLRFAVCRCGLRRSAPRRKGLRLRLRCALAACGPLAPGKACPPRRALAAARCGCGLRRLGPWRGRGGGEVEMRLRRATAACEGWPPMEGGAHGAGPVLLRPRTKKALSGSVMGNYGRRGGVNKGLECVIAFAIVLVQSPSLPNSSKPCGHPERERRAACGGGGRGLAQRWEGAVVRPRRGQGVRREPRALVGGAPGRQQRRGGSRRRLWS